MSDYLAADRLRERVLEDYDPRILVWCRVGLYEILDLFLEFLRALYTRCEDYAGLDDLSPDLVRSCGHTAFEHIRKLEDNILYLERSYTVAG